VTASAHAKTAVKVEINEKKYEVESPTTGAHLRELGNIPTENNLFRETKGGGPDELIRPEGTYELTKHDEFYDLPKGTVG
jgi:hypothetical protein